MLGVEYCAMANPRSMLSRISQQFLDRLSQTFLSQKGEEIYLKNWRLFVCPLAIKISTPHSEHFEYKFDSHSIFQLLFFFEENSNLGIKNLRINFIIGNYHGRLCLFIFLLWAWLWVVVISSSKHLWEIHGKVHSLIISVSSLLFTYSLLQVRSRWILFLKE